MSLNPAEGAAELLALAAASLEASQLCGQKASYRPNAVWMDEDEIALAFGGLSDALRTLDRVAPEGDPSWPHTTVLAIKGIRWSLEEALDPWGWEPIRDEPDARAAWITERKREWEATVERPYLEAVIALLESLDDIRNVSRSISDLATRGRARGYGASRPGPGATDAPLDRFRRAEATYMRTPRLSEYPALVFDSEMPWIGRLMAASQAIRTDLDDLAVPPGDPRRPSEDRVRRIAPILATFLESTEAHRRALADSREPPERWSGAQRAMIDSAQSLNAALGGSPWHDGTFARPQGWDTDLATALNDLAFAFESLVGNNGHGWGLRAWIELEHGPPRLANWLIDRMAERPTYQPYEYGPPAFQALDTMRRSLVLLAGRFPVATTKPKDALHGSPATNAERESKPRPAPKATKGKPRNQGFNAQCVAAYYALAHERIGRDEVDLPTPTEVANRVGCSLATASRAIHSIRSEHSQLERGSRRG